MTRALTAYRRLKPADPSTFQASIATPKQQVKRAVRLNSSQVAQLVGQYQAGATVYDLATQFGMDRKTVSQRLKQAGVKLRRQSPTTIEIDEMVRLYESGLSLARVGELLGFEGRTVQLYIRERGVTTRDTHGRVRGF